jgi:heavy metal sensor kinase
VRLSIRGRLTLWNLLALAVVVLGFSALVYALLTRALYRQIDANLREGLRQLELVDQASEDREKRLRYWIHELHEHNGIFGVIYSPGGDVHARTEELAEVSVPPPPAPSGETRLHDGTIPALGRQRLLEGRLHLGGKQLAVVLMAPLEGVDRERSRLRAALALAAPVALLFSGAVGYLLARRALAPVAWLRRLAREVTASRLDRRLPVDSPFDELGKLAVTINDMIARLERSFAEVRRFTADASHELRTPLAAIRAEAEIALARDAGLPPEQRAMLGSILEECDRLTHLTDQLLALAREDAGVAPQQRETVDLAGLALGVAETMRPLAEAKELLLSASAPNPAPVLGDAGRLRQVFYNLLDNAIKYTPAGGAVKLGIKSEGENVVATVSDTGIGIPPEHLRHVFERFYRVDKARSREQGGTGLGLSIARSIVAAHGGSIEAASGPAGAAFTVTLPRNGAEQEGRGN